MITRNMILLGRCSCPDIHSHAEPIGIIIFIFTGLPALIVLADIFGVLSTGQQFVNKVHFRVTEVARKGLQNILSQSGRLIMKPSLLLLFTVFSFFAIQAQTSDTLSFFTATRGIYTSYTSVRNGIPNRLDSFHIVLRTKSDIFLLGGGPYAFELDSADKSQWRELRKALVGISDGRQFYISDKYTSGGWMGLSKCYLQGPYIVSMTRGSAGQYTGGGLIPGLIPFGSGTVINIRTREHNPLSEGFIKGLLKKYPDLNQEYKNMFGLMNHAIEILEKVNQKENMQPDK
jgi:hypothetical protein